MLPDEKMSFVYTAWFVPTNNNIFDQYRLYRCDRNVNGTEQEFFNNKG